MAIVRVAAAAAAGSARGASAPRGYAGGFVPPDSAAQWTDRTLGACAGSAVGRIRGVGAGGVPPRTARADGRVAPPRAHGVQGDSAPLGQADSAGTRGARRLAGRVHLARAHRLSG